MYYLSCFHEPQKTMCKLINRLRETTIRYVRCIDNILSIDSGLKLMPSAIKVPKGQLTDCTTSCFKMIELNILNSIESSILSL